MFSEKWKTRSPCCNSTLQTSQWICPKLYETCPWPWPRPWPRPAQAPGPACLGGWQCLWFHSHKSVHLPASAFCCFSIFSRRPSKESILVLICVNSFLIVCNSSDFTGRGKGTERTGSQRLGLRTHLTDTLCFPQMLSNPKTLWSPIRSDRLQLPAHRGLDHTVILQDGSLWRVFSPMWCRGGGI